ncbi:MAG: glycosyltransferase family 4 protein [Candidatus Eiseniibacteriota bacterium]|nr:MAG: glycosyltransferase family 4 protein [Candidatus Eisenbacteria bacterium]
MAQSGTRLDRVALVTDSFTTGGGLNQIYHVASGMSDIQFGVFADGGSDTEGLERLANVVLFDRGYGRGYINEYGPQIVHIHHLRPLLSYYSNTLRRAGIPVLFSVHGIHLHRYEFLPGLRSGVGRLLRLNLERHLYRKVSRLIAVSEEDQRYLRENHGIDSCIHVPNGIDFETFDRIRLSKQGLRKEFSLPPNSLLFLTVGRFSFQKGYDLLIKALGLARRNLSGRDVKFVLVGEGEELVSATNLAREQGVSDIVLFLGRVQGAGRLMKASDVFVLPSRWEGLPITLLEAACCRLPILCSDTYGSREIVKDGETGLTFENQNVEQLAARILEVVDGKHDLEALASKADAKVRAKHSLDAMVAKLRSVYNELLGIAAAATD